MHEVGSMRRISDIVLDSFWMIVDVEHATRLVLRVDDLVTCMQKKSRSEHCSLIMVTYFGQICITTYMYYGNDKRETFA